MSNFSEKKGCWQSTLLNHFPEIFHGASTRERPRQQIFNMSYEFQEEAVVTRNRRDFLKELSGDASAHIISSFQTHSDHIFVFREGDDFPEGEIPDTDAFVTDVSGVALMTKTADCQPVFLYDPVKKVVGMVHSGWKGSLQNIIGKTVQVMRDEFAVEPSDIRAAIGPALGPCCAEFSNPKTELNEAAQPFVRPNRHVDFWAMSVAQLKAEGVQRENIELSEICTVCSVDEWFSYRGDRRQGEDLGRLAGVIGLR
jgi:YfiH family protein